MTKPLLSLSHFHGDGNFPSHEFEDDPEYDTALDTLADEYVQEEIEAYTATGKNIDQSAGQRSSQKSI